MTREKEKDLKRMGTLLQKEGKEGVPPLLPVADLEGEML